MKQNVIWIFGDQHRAQALGINGDENVSTPHIDTLARLGLNYTRAVSGFPLCCPFRGSLLTSKYPHKCVPGHEYALDENTRTIAHAFNDNGYHTAYFGKWHLDGFEEKNMKDHDCNSQLNLGRAVFHVVPPHRRGGFKRWYGYDNNNSPWDTWVHGGEGKETESIKLDGYETDCLTDMLIEYLSEKKDDNFFAVLSVQPPHNPYVAPSDYQKNYSPGKIKFRENVPNIQSIRETASKDLAGYYGQIENLDDNVGRIQIALKDLGLSESTHIVFFSDHGDMHGSHGQFKKTNPYEESIRIPFIIGGEAMRYNGRLNGECDVPLNHVDIAPTTLGLCGLDIPDWMEGTNYAHYRMKGRTKDNEPTSAYLQSVIPTRHGDSTDLPWRGIVTIDNWKYVCFENTVWLMFDLNEDPYELVNLAHNTKYLTKRKELNDELQSWIDKTDDKFTLPIIEEV
ncbi:sulfatase [Acidaminobacter sp. JC074]|uniref:sulfatase family protein n=1 Tax=Acidaminobacter sp. JC074 TaxID=2530199 RepID=UPI001F0F4C9C|nr:sulfatase [Acidaminobacter sp. JC074]MCH4887612.1 sulfatase [Acidaminobacter sp. JC074]